MLMETNFGQQKSADIRCLSLNDKKAQCRPVGNDQQCRQQHDHKRKGRPIEFRNGFIKAVAGNKQVHSHGWCEVTDLHVGQKYDAQMDRVDPIIDRHWEYNGYHNNQSGKNV
jgi:hypothetical protein